MREGLLIFSISCLTAAGLLRVYEILCELFKNTKWETRVPYTVLCRETVYFCGSILSQNKIKFCPEVRISYYKHKTYLGVFNGDIVIYIQKNEDIATLVNTVLHEVRHYMQSKTDKQYNRYDEFLLNLGYWNNPLEKDARNFAEQHCNKALAYLESKGLIEKA